MKAKAATIETALMMMAHGFDHRDCPDHGKHPDHFGPLIDKSPEQVADMRQSHRQKRCAKCGFYALWVPRKGRS